MSELIKELYKITGIAMQLHQELGPDHEEKVYHKMLLGRLRKLGYTVVDRPRIKLLDDQGKLVRTFIPDLRVRLSTTQVLIELKSDPKGIHESDRRQARAYLSISPGDQAVQLLNFGAENLGHSRVYQHAVVWREE